MTLFCVCNKRRPPLHAFYRCVRWSRIYNILWPLWRHKKHNDTNKIKKYYVLKALTLLSGFIILFSPLDRWLIAISHTQVIIDIRDFFYLPRNTQSARCLNRYNSNAWCTYSWKNKRYWIIEHWKII